MWEEGLILPACTYILYVCFLLNASESFCCVVLTVSFDILAGERELSMSHIQIAINLPLAGISR